MSQICKTCTLQVNSKSPGLQCIFCMDFYHIKCIKITKTQLDVLSSINGCIWKCTGCTSLKSDNDKLINIIESLQQTVNSLKNEIRELRDAQKKVNITDSIINEISDRQKREKNIIIYKLKEQDGTSTEKKTADLLTVKNIIKTISPDICVNDIKTFRLGKSDNRHAPVKVMLSSREDVLKILRNKRKLKDSNYNVHISTDQTKMQQEYFSKLKSELSERKQNGEPDLYIKYVNGIPNICQPKNGTLTLVM